MAKTILIVEDEYLIALDLQLALGEAGWRVLGPAATVTDALILLAADRPDVAILDARLGDEPVTPVADALKRLGIPFAIASAYAQPADFGGESLATAVNMGKPYQMASMLALLEQLVSN